MKRWLSLKEASSYANIGGKRLKFLALDGIIRGCKDPDSGRGDWIFDRESIDGYRLSQMTVEGPKEKALAILRGVGL